MAEQRVNEWPFDDPENCRTIVSRTIFENDASIVAVVHDEEGDWLFLDGGDNSDSARLIVVALGQVAKKDPTILKLADLPHGWEAERDTSDGAWRRFKTEESEEDGHVCDIDDEKVVSDIERFGLTVMLVEGDEETPSFAYSIGLFRNYGHPEIIVFGLDFEVMSSIVNEVGEQVKTGKHYETEKIYFGLIEKYGCVFEPVAERHYAEYFGYANWFYKGTDFPALQCVWPDKAGLYPWHEDFNPEWLAAQPLLGTGDETE